MENTLWQKYKDQGLVVWAIGHENNATDLNVFRQQMGMTFPVLHDDGGAVIAQYNPGKKQTNSVYPQDWIIGADGTVVYVNTAYKPNEMIAVIEAELAK